jgi:gas vesicle protein
MNNIKSLVHTALDAERYSDAYKSAWRALFKQAEALCKLVPNRDLDPATLVDDWVAEYQDTIDHCNPADDQVAGDMSCMQAISKQQQDFLADIRKQYMEAIAQSRNPKHSHKLQREFREIAKRLRKLHTEESNTNIRSIPFEIYEEFGDKSDFVESMSDTEQYVSLQEYRETFNQEPECDPDNSLRVGDTYRRNRGKPYGSVGVLAGLYENTLPEPPYYNRKLQLRALRNSENPDDIRLLFSLTLPTRRDESDDEWATKVARRRNNMNKLISKLS